jgi:hypothetical protein
MRGACLSIAMIPNQRGGVVQAMGFVAFGVINECLVVQFTDDQIVLESTWQAGSAFHKNPVGWIEKSDFSYARLPIKSI